MDTYGKETKLEAEEQQSSLLLLKHGVSKGLGGMARVYQITK